MSTVADAVVTFNTGRDLIVLTLAAVAVDWMEAGITTPVWDVESREIDPDAWEELRVRLLPAEVTMICSERDWDSPMVGYSWCTKAPGHELPHDFRYDATE